MARGKKNRKGPERKNRSRKFSGKKSSDKGKPYQDLPEIKILVMPFGLVAMKNSKIIKKEIWPREKQAENYFNREKVAKDFSSGIHVRAKRKFEYPAHEKIMQFSKEMAPKFDFQEFMVELTKLKLKKGYSKDKIISLAVGLFEEVTKTINMFYEHLRVWYSDYWPEKVHETDSMDSFAEIVGKKRNQSSMGFDFEEDDLKILLTGGEQLKNLMSFKKILNDYIESLVNEIAPNTSKIAGAVLTAKLMSIAGGLDKLAEMPSSTIQLLGAEKALFRHIRKKTRPPKYGVLLGHNLMAEVPLKNRGKLARILASKISMCVKIDFYSKGKDSRWEEILSDLRKKVENLK